MWLQIQKMVISGGDFKPDTLKTKEMVSLLLDDDEMKSRCKCTFRITVVFLYVNIVPSVDSTGRQATCCVCVC